MENIIQENAMLITLQINCAGFTRKDRDVTDKVNAEHAASHNAGKYDKHLLDPRMVDGPQRAARAARGDHERLTLPWDGTYRLLPVELFDQYMTTMDDHKRRFNSAVSNLAGKLPQLIEQRRKQLNGMFREDDYLRYAALESMYEFKWRARDVPTGANFYAKIVDDKAAQIRAEIDDDNADLLRSATRHTFERLHKAVSHIATCLDGYESVEVRKAGGKKKTEANRRLYDTMITNLGDLVNILPALNVAGDPDLAALVDDIKGSELLRHDVAEFKDPSNAEVVKVVQSEASEITDRLAGFFGG
jgi:hypothetical protein